MSEQGDRERQPGKNFIRLFSGLNVALYRMSGGRIMGRLGGRDICLVTMRGARSGRTLTRPLMHVPYRDGVILVASLGGAPSHPVWYHNLVANPDIEVQVGAEKLSLRARQARPEEKAEVWPRCVESYPDFQTYQDRTERDIPVFICEPRA